MTPKVLKPERMRELYETTVAQHLSPALAQVFSAVPDMVLTGPRESEADHISVVPVRLDCEGASRKFESLVIPPYAQRPGTILTLICKHSVQTRRALTGRPPRLPTNEYQYLEEEQIATFRSDLHELFPMIASDIKHSDLPAHKLLDA